LGWILLNHAYYLVQQVGKQRQITEQLGIGSDAVVCAVKQQSRFKARKEFQKDKSDQFCDHCKCEGHSIDYMVSLKGTRKIKENQVEEWLAQVSAVPQDDQPQDSSKEIRLKRIRLITAF